MLIYNRLTGEALECQSVDAREILAASPDVYSTTAPDPLDHDHDGHRGGSAPSTETGYAAMTVPALKDSAESRGVDLGDATKKADIIAALELADEAAAEAVVETPVEA